MILYGKHFVDKSDEKKLISTLNSKYLTSGPIQKKFENKIKSITKSKHVNVCNSATSALMVSFYAIGLSKDDTIIMPAINFIASYNMAKKIGAKIYFADVDKYTGQMTYKNILDCIKKFKLKKIKVIVTMHLGGYPENSIEIFKIKKKYKCFIVEDACHAFGAKYEYRKKKIPVGSCVHSDISTFSFHPVKGVTTGEGGAVTTNDSKLAKKMSLLISHGVVRKKNHWKYDVILNGFNLRLSEINCSLGLSQLKKLSNFISYRKKIYNHYEKKLKFFNDFIKIPNYQIKNSPSYHLMIISINFNKLKSNRDLFYKFMLKNKIYLQLHYHPIFLFSIFKKNKRFYIKNYPGSIFYSKNSCSFPIYHNISIKTVDYVINKMKIFFKLLK